MKVIDCSACGSVLRVSLGDDGLKDYWGDDWDDAPYDLNAGDVYDQYVSKVRCVWLGFDAQVEFIHTDYSKEGLRREGVPFVRVCFGDGMDKARYVRFDEPESDFDMDFDGISMDVPEHVGGASGSDSSPVA